MANTTFKEVHTVGSGKGGSTKTTLALELASNAHGEGRPYKLMEIDNNPRLSMYLGADALAVTMRLTDETANSLKDRFAVVKQFNPVWEAICAADTDRVLIDLGGGANEAFLNYLEWNDVPEASEDEGIRWRFISPTLAETSSLTGAYNYLGRAHSLFADAADYWLVRTNVHGDAAFQEIASQAYWKEFLKKAKAMNLKLIDVGPMSSSIPNTLGKPAGEVQVILTEMIEATKNGGLDFSDKDVRDICNVLGISTETQPASARLTIRQSLKPLAGWLVDTSKALEPIYTSPVGAEG